MLGECKTLVPIEFRFNRLEFICKQRFEEELLAQPQRQPHAERGKPLRAEREIGFEQALELQKGLVIEGDVVDIREGGTASVEAILDGETWIVGIKFFACETFFLGGGHDAAIDD